MNNDFDVLVSSILDGMFVSRRKLMSCFKIKVYIFSIKKYVQMFFYIFDEFLEVTLALIDSSES
jgi:hypothetical protein